MCSGTPSEIFNVFLWNDRSTKFEEQLVLWHGKDLSLKRRQSKIPLGVPNHIFVAKPKPGSSPESCRWYNGAIVAWDLHTHFLLCYYLPNKLEVFAVGLQPSKPASSGMAMRQQRGGQKPPETIIHFNPKEVPWACTGFISVTDA